MTYTISYGNQYNYNQLSSLDSSSNIINNVFVVNGTSIVDSNFNLELNYSSTPNVYVSYSITAIQLE